MRRKAEEKKPFEVEHYRGQSFSNSFFEDGQRVDGGDRGGNSSPISPGGGGGGRRFSGQDELPTLDELAGSSPVDEPAPN